MKKEHKKLQLRWLRLDNAAKIFPAVRRRHWSNVYRQSITLREDVDVKVMQSALDVTVKRFPSIAARLRKGMFWYYLQQVASPPKIREEYSYPLVYMSKEEMRKCALRVIVYNNRVAIEFFHALTDGNGALIFLKNLVAEYLEQKHGISIPFEKGIVDRRIEPLEEELEDCFPKNAGAVPVSRKNTLAWRMYGYPERNGFLNLTCFKFSAKEALELAHKHNSTLTVFISAAIMMALINLQNEKTPIKKQQKRIKVLIPVNLRKLFPSKTLRNFVLYIIPEVDPRLGEYTFDEICKVIYHKMGAELTPKYMSRLIATNVNSEQNTLIRLVPLPIKNLVMKAIFDKVGERTSCLSFSNVGRAEVPEIMNQYIERFDFILGVQSTAPYNCAMISYEDTICMNFIRSIRDAELEKHFYAVLQNLGLHVTVESNRNER